MSDFPGKTSKRRPRQITREEERLRYTYADGKIDFKEFERRYKKLKAQGLIRRSGRRVE